MRGERDKNQWQDALSLCVRVLLRRYTEYTHTHTHSLLSTRLNKRLDSISQLLLCSALSHKLDFVASWLLTCLTEVAGRI